MTWDNVHTKERALALFAKLKEVRCSKPDLGNCLVWTGGKNRRGYGKIMSRGRNYYTHRMMMELYLRRLLTADEVVMHECDNPACCARDHLKIGSLLDNIKDMYSKGRSSSQKKGKRRCMRLTEGLVVQIKVWLAMGQSANSISARIGCGEATVRDIKEGRTWKDVKAAQPKLF